MDQEVWNEYKDDSGNTSYVIASPTAELYANSFNKTSTANNRSGKITFKLDSNGYTYDGDASISMEYNNQIYNNGNSNLRLASPRNASQGTACYVNAQRGSISGININIGYGLRPVVMIPRDKFQYEIL